MRDKKIYVRPAEFRANPSGGRFVKIHTEGKGIGVFKTLFVGFLVLIQLALMLLLFLGVSNSFYWYQLVALILSLLCCIHVLSSEKTGQTKTVWVLFLIAFFYFGFIFYLLSSEYIFFAKAKRRYAAVFSRTAQYVPEYPALNNVSKQVERDCAYLKNAGGFTAYTNSRLKYFPSGAQLFDDVLPALEKAEKFIFIEFFIISDGILLNKFYEILAEKAARGADVRIICDGMGSHGTLSYKTRKKFKKAGIKLHFFNRIVPHFTFALNLRDHRKIIVIDGKTAYTGGCNLADEYVNQKRMHGYWKDTGLKIEGDAVQGLALTFLRQWEFICGVAEDYSPYLKAFPAEGNSAVVPYAGGKEYNRAICKGVYENIIAGAKEKLYIMTPYFVPDEDTANLLAQKALSGVDVRIILPAVPDKAYVYRVTVDNAERLLSSGVKVCKMRHSFVHSKLILSENCAVVGSVNIDLRSYYNQFENAVYFNDAEAMREVLCDFENTFKACDAVTEENSARNKLIPRICAGVLRIFSPLM